MPITGSLMERPIYGLNLMQRNPVAAEASSWTSPDWRLDQKASKGQYEAVDFQSLFSGVGSKAGYEEDTGIDLSVSAYVGTKQGRKPIEGVAGKPGPRRQEVFEEESVQQMLQYLRLSS